MQNVVSPGPFSTNQDQNQSDYRFELHITDYRWMRMDQDHKRTRYIFAPNLQHLIYYSKYFNEPGFLPLTPCLSAPRKYLRPYWKVANFFANTVGKAKIKKNVFFLFKSERGLFIMFSFGVKEITKSKHYKSKIKEGG